VKRARSTRATQNWPRDKIQMSKNGHARRTENPTRRRQGSARDTIGRQQANLNQAR